MYDVIMESVRLSIHEQMTSVGEEILCVLEKQQLRDDVICQLNLHVRVFVLERLRVAAQFMCILFQSEMSKLHSTSAVCTEVSPEHEERSSRLVQEEPQPPHIKEEQKEEQEEEADVSTLTSLHDKTSCDSQSEFLHLPVCEKGSSVEQQDENNHLLQEEPEPPQIKEEQQELLQKPEVADGSTMTLLPTVKSEDDHVENGETEPLANPSTAHVNTQADVENCGASQPTSADQLLSSHCSESDNTEDSDDWEEAREDQLDSSTPARRSPRQRSSLSDKPSQDSPESSEQQTPSTRGRSGRKIRSCSVCGKTFDHMGTLRRHFQSHTGEKPFICIVCVKGFGHKVDLKRHMTIHTGEKPFTCEVCGKGFGHVGDLKRHVRTHTGEKPFTCTVCGKGVGRMFELTLHMRTHTGEKPFNCAVCGKGFRGSGNLSQHMRTHTGERPFTCAVCEQRFSLSTNLKRHMRTHAANGKKQQKASSDGDPVKKKKTRTNTCELQGAPSDDVQGRAGTGTVEKPFYHADDQACARTAVERPPYAAESLDRAGTGAAGMKGPVAL